MVLTVQNSPAQIEMQLQAVENMTDSLCRLKYCNTLPDIPFDLKSISCPLDDKTYIEYNPTSLERSYKFQILADHDLGLNMNLVNKDKYKVRYNFQVDEPDENILEEDVLDLQDFKRSSHHARSVSWLRRTEYISTEKTRFQPQAIEKVEAKVGFSIKMNFKEETLYTDRESQMKAIEKTFEDNKKPIEKHYSKPNVHMVETLNVFPDFKNWKFPCAQVIFDSDPAPVGRSVPAQMEEMSQAMIRGVINESGEEFVAYFLPTKETMIKRREDAVEERPYDDDYEYEYKMAREYNWNVKSKSSKGYEENYFLIVQPDGVFYNEMETRVRLSKRRQKIGTQSSSTNTSLIVSHVPINEQESSIHKLRETQLQPYDEEEEVKAEEAAKKAMQAVKESAKEMETKNKTDSDDDDDNESRKGDSKKSNLVSDSDVSDDEEECVATANTKRDNSETVDSDKGKNYKRQRAVSVKKSNSHKVISGSDESDISGEESSQSSDSEEERKVKRVSNKASSDSDNTDVEMRSDKSSERGSSEQESNRGSDSDE